MNKKMDTGYANSIRNKYYAQVVVGASSTSNIYVIPECSKVDVDLDTNSTIEFTLFPIPKEDIIVDIDFSTANWFEWDGISEISPNASAFRITNAGGSSETSLVRCV